MKRTTLIPTIITAALLTTTACSADEPDRAEPGVAGTDVDGTDGDGTDGDGTDGGGTVADGTAPTRADGSARFAKVALRQFDECGAFLDYVHTEGAERVGPYGFGDQRGWPVDDVVMMEAPAMEAVEEMDLAAPADAEVSVARDGGVAGTDFSTTNVQVDGVDEPDIVKTDGSRILTLTNGTLRYTEIGPGGVSATVRGSIVVMSADGGSIGRDMLVAGDRAFVIVESPSFGYPVLLDDVVPMDAGLAVDVEETVDVVDGDAEARFIDEPVPVEPMPVEPIVVDPGVWPGPRTMSATTSIIEVDLSDPDNLAVAGTLEVEGRYISARSIGDTARIAVTTPPTDLGFLYPSSGAADESATEANRRLVLDSTIDDWLPEYELTNADGTTTGQLVTCSAVHAPGEFAGFDMLSVVTLPLDSSLGAPTETTSVMATGDTVYASQDRLYVSTNEWESPTFDDQQRGVWEENYQTGIHRFSLPADGGRALYEASGTVDGHLLNQFSMHDDDGTFFVATTRGTPWSSDQSDSQIVAMQVDGDRLEQVGQVGGMGKGEQIFSVRYVDRTAYVVTFRQTDPFYVVDLSSPTDLVVRGELKIPGVSNYLHPISDTLVIGVGQDATDDGGRTGSKVSLFDVSDPSAPREVDVWTMPGASSDIEFDHRAFLWWAPTSTAVIPLVSWEQQFAGAVVLNVTADGITEAGWISHVEEAADAPGQTDCRVVTGDDVSGDSELFWIVEERGSQVQLCGPDDVGGATGHYCETIPVDQLDDYFGFFPSDDEVGTEFGVDLTGVDRLEWCWLDGGFNGYEDRIERTLVIGDQFWTVAATGLQANDVDTLAVTATVDF